MQCEASTPVCSNQGVQLLGSVYMCCNKLTATCTKGKWKQPQIANLVKSVYISNTFLCSVLATCLISSLVYCQSEVLEFLVI
jgi:hypothetical protein